MMSPGSRRGPLPVYSIVFASFFDTHAQLAILALFASSVGADAFWVGIAVGIYSVFNIAGNGIGGLAIDKWGWRVTLLSGLILVNVALYGYQLVETIGTLLAVRSLNGLAGGILIPATLASLSPSSGQTLEGHHGKGFALYGMSIGLAALSGPPFAGIISNQYGFKAAYLGIALLMSVATLLAVIYLRHDRLNVQESQRFNLSAGYFKLAASSVTACLIAFAMMAGTGTLAAFLPMMAEQLGYSQSGIGMLFGIFALMAILLQVFRARGGFSRTRPFWLAVSGVGSLVIALLSMHFAVGKSTFMAAVALYGASFGIVFPTILLLLAHGTKPENKGIVTGVFFAFYSLGTVIVPPIAGLVWRQNPGISPPLTAVAFMTIIMMLAFRWGFECASYASLEEMRASS